MRVDVYPTVSSMPDAEVFAGRVAVVIDVLRATSTITTALANGADTVVPVLAPTEAFAVAQANPARAFILGGERQSVRIPGFHLGNSPLEYTETRVRGRPLLFTTTNGTRAIRAAGTASTVYIAAFLNAPAVARELSTLGRDVAICCAGTHDQFSLEDVGCAGAIIEFMGRADAPLELNDLGYVAREIYRKFAGRLADLLHQSEHGQSLLKLGLQADLLFCSQLGSLSLLPRYGNGQVSV